jgi:hypothetical protein
MEEVDSANRDTRRRRKRQELPSVPDDELIPLAPRQAAQADPDANAGSDYDAMPDSDVPLADVPVRLSIPNHVFRPARILVNPRCVTTYAGVSHTQLALDLFGPERDDAGPRGGIGKYVLEDWDGAPESFVCQEQRYVVCVINRTLNAADSCMADKREEDQQQKRSGDLVSPSMTSCSGLHDPLICSLPFRCLYLEYIDVPSIYHLDPRCATLYYMDFHRTEPDRDTRTAVEMHFYGESTCTSIAAVIQGYDSDIY